MRIIIILGIILMPMANYCQGKIVPLKIGDKVPEISLYIWQGGKQVRKNLSDYYRDKGMIISFWATWCGACMVSLKEEHRVMRTSNSGVKVLPITYEDSAVIQKFINKNVYLKGLSYDYATNDNRLMGILFPFKKIPHEVWVDRDGVVKGITYPDQVTIENLRSFADGRTMRLKEKRDNMEFKIGDTLDAGEKFIYRSVLTGYREDLLGWVGTISSPFDKQPKVNMFQGLNCSILQLFYCAFNNGKGLPVNYKRIELQVKDTTPINPDNSLLGTELSKFDDYKYCYEFILPQKVPESAYGKYMLNDLNRIFNYTARVEKRNQECWLLTAFDTSLLNARQPQLAKLTIKFKNGYPTMAKNITTSILVKYLEEEMQTIPVIDETGITNSFDFIFSDGFLSGNGSYNIDNLQKNLHHYGLQLKKEIRETDKLIVVEKEKPGE